MVLASVLATIEKRKRRKRYWHKVQVVGAFVTRRKRKMNFSIASQ